MGSVGWPYPCAVGRVRWHRAEHTGVTKYTLQLNEVIKSKPAVAERQNVTTFELVTVQTFRTAAKLQLTASAESCPHPAIVIACYML